MIYFLYECQRLGGVVTWGHLVGGHSSEKGVCPTCAFTCFFIVLFSFLSGSGSGYGVVLEENPVFSDRREEIDERDDYECQNGNKVWKKLFHLRLDDLQFMIEV